MRLTQRYDMNFVNSVTLREYSMYQYAYEMAKIDRMEQESMNAFFNRIAQGAEDKLSPNDIYDPISEQLSLFNQDDELEMNSAQEFIYQFNKRGG